MDWEDKILNSDAGRSSPAKALELIEGIKLGIGATPSTPDTSQSPTGEGDGSS